MSSVLSTGHVERIGLGTQLQATDQIARIHASWQADAASDTHIDISSSGRLRSATSALLDVAQQLSNDATWRATQATSNNPDAVSATSDASTPLGQYGVTVDAIAIGQATASATFSSISTVIGLGTMNIELGSWNGSQTAFLPNPNWPKASVSIGLHDNPMERIRDKINAAGIGVIASVVTDATGSLLVLRSTHTGAEQGFKVSVEPDESSPDPGLSALGYDPSSQANTNGMALIQPAQDARLSINDQQLSASGNVIDSGVSGLTLQVRAPTSEAHITVSANPEVAVQAMSQFAQRFNQLSNILNCGQGQTDTDAGTQALAQQLVEGVQTTVSGSDSGILQAGGLQLDAQNRLELDTQRTLQVLQTPDQGLSSAWQRLASMVSSTASPMNAFIYGNAGPVDVVSADTPGQTNAPATGGLLRERLLALYRQSQLDLEHAVAGQEQPVNSESMA